MNELQVIKKNDVLVTDSRDVAKMIGKQHSNLMRDIQGYKNILEANSTLNSPNFFIESTYIDSQNKTRPCFLLTRKGCDMVANKMTGEKGVLFTATYVTRFEEMENNLKNNIQLALPQTYKEALIALVEKVEENERLEAEKAIVDQKLIEQEPQVKYAKTIQATEYAIPVSDFAKNTKITTGYGPNKLHALLREKKILMSTYDFKNMPQQRYVDQGYFETEQYPFEKNGRKMIGMKAKITPKGQIWVLKKIEQWKQQDEE